MKKSLVGLALVAAALGAGAQTLSLDSPHAYSFTGFDASGFAPNSFTSGLFATVLVSGPATVTYEYVGSESGYNTSLFASFFSGTGLVTENAGSRAVGTVNAGGLLDFSFRDGTGSSLHNSLGASFTGASNPSFLILGSNVATSGQTSYLLGYNDSFRGDADFDDIVVKVSVSPIPEPSTYALMLAGLAAVGFVARRRRSS
jgi:hypothetical protein